jgi:hypothetical protein
MTEYKSILLVEDDELIDETEVDTLNKEFDDGWDYVDSITQTVSTGNSYSYRSGVIVILKREKVSL